MAFKRTLESIQNVIIMAQCCSADLAYAMLDKERHLKDAQCEQDDLLVIQLSTEALRNYTPASTTNNLTELQVEDVIENIYEKCRDIQESGDDIVETEIAEPC